MSRIGIVGTTGWATTLGILAARAGNETVLWARSDEDASQLQQARENVRLLPGSMFPENLSVSASPGSALGDAEIILVSVPSVTMRENLQRVRNTLRQNSIVACATTDAPPK